MGTELGNRSGVVLTQPFTGLTAPGSICNPRIGIGAPLCPLSIWWECPPQIMEDKSTDRVVSPHRQQVALVGAGSFAASLKGK